MIVVLDTLTACGDGEFDELSIPICGCAVTWAAAEQDEVVVISQLLAKIQEAVSQQESGA